MTEEEAKMVPIRRLWAAMLDSAITDYRNAIMYENDIQRGKVEKDLEGMGYGKYCDMLAYGARRFKWRVTQAAKETPIGKCRRMTCPSCDGERTVWIYNRKRSYCAVCTACGLRYRIPKEL